MGKHSRPKKTKSGRWLPAAALVLLLALGLWAGLRLRQGSDASSVPDAAPAAETSEPAPAPTPEPEIGLLRLTEVMAKNRATLRAEDGSFPDWIELTNTGSEAVELQGWSLSDRDQPGWLLPERSLAPGDRLVIYADGSGRTEGAWYADFALSGDETVYLYSPAGFRADALACCEAADHAVALDESGLPCETRSATPGFENSAAGIEAFAASLQAPGPLCIAEAAVSNFSLLRQNDGKYYDWVELLNCSDRTLELSDFALSDQWDEPGLWRLPEGSLAPGGSVLVICAGEEQAASAGGWTAPFSLDAAEEQLFLTAADGSLCDWVYLHDVPTGGSMGRESGAEGWFYYAAPSPGESNWGGCRRVAAKPVCPEGDGVYEGVESVTVTLTAPGEIHYTLDSSVPNEYSPVYSGPLTISSTTVLRAVALEPGCLPSRVLTLNYFLNEGCSLPILSLVTDDHDRFRSLYLQGIKYKEVPCSLSFYEEGGSFTMAGGVSMKGWTSLSLPKKSMGVSFGGYGDGDLRYDLFGNGVDRFANLSIRAGQDYLFGVIRNELFQELCLEASDHVLTQSSRYCILFWDGEYRGIYCLKEDLSRQYYASHAGISKQDAEMLKTIEIGAESELWQEVLGYALKNDMSQPEHYEHFCQRLDVDCLIDWIILEAYCNNTDINGNMRYFRDRNGGKWQIAYYDLDWSFRYPINCFDNVIYPTRSVQIAPVIQKLLDNGDFRDQLARRTVELCRGALSNEHVLQKIDEMQALLEPDMERDKTKWDSSVRSWHIFLDELRDYVTDNDYENLMIRALFNSILHLSAEEQAAYLNN